MSFDPLIVTKLEILELFGAKKNNQVTKCKMKGPSKINRLLAERNKDTLDNYYLLKTPW